MAYEFGARCHASLYLVEIEHSHIAPYFEDFPLVEFEEVIVSFHGFEKLPFFLDLVLTLLTQLNLVYVFNLLDLPKNFG